MSKDKKDKVFIFRLSSKEMDRLKKAAIKSKMSVSKYLRSKIDQ